MSGRLLFRRPPWTRITRLGIASILTLALVTLVLYHYRKSQQHYLDANSPLNHLLSTDIHSHDWKTTCRDHGFAPFAHPRKVYDLVLLSTELDWLEIRLHTHAEYVDYFVVVESPTTFTHKPKPLLLKENWSRFAPFHHKIIHRIVKDPIISTRHWDHEDFLRNSLLQEVFPTLLSTPQEAQKNDVLLVSDMDELLKPTSLLLLRHCDFPARLTLRSHFYYYSFQFLHRGEQWPHPQATIFQDSIENTLAPNDLRMNLLSPGSFPPVAALSRWWNSATLWNAGWHCSSCFSTIKEMQVKMESFSHQGWNTKDNRDGRKILERVRNGEDLFGRAGEVYERVEGNRDVPGWVLGEWEREGRFGYLLNRDGVDGGFEDYGEVVSVSVSVSERVGERVSE